MKIYKVLSADSDPSGLEIILNRLSEQGWVLKAVTQGHRHFLFLEKDATVN